MSPSISGLITSRRNPLVRRLRALHGGSGRREQGLLLLEGTHLLQEVLRLELEPELVLATPAWIDAHSALIGCLGAAVQLQPAAQEVVEVATTTRHPDGVVLTLAMTALPAPSEAWVDQGFLLALDRLQDPGNLGMVLRTALAAGVDQVWLGEGADPLQPKVLRASSGAALALPLERLEGAALRTRLEQAQRLGFQLVAAVVPGQQPHPGPLPYWQLDWTVPPCCCWAMKGAVWRRSCRPWLLGASPSPIARRWNR